MRESEFNFGLEGLNSGLRKNPKHPFNEPSLVECYNVGPGVESPEVFKPIQDLNSDTSTYGEGLEVTPALTRSITIKVKDYVSMSDVSGAEVFIDGISYGLADVSGEVNIANIEIGGHSIRIVKTGYLDSVSDDLLNDYFVVV